jgi:hypothetical protein
MQQPGTAHRNMRLDSTSTLAGPGRLSTASGLWIRAARGSASSSVPSPAAIVCFSVMRAEVFAA